MEKESKELKAALTGQKIEPVMASAKKTTPIKKMEYAAVEPLRLDNPYNAAGGVTAEKAILFRRVLLPNMTLQKT